MARELDEVARVATVMVDGDVCQRIVTPRALDYMFKNDPRDPWAAGDNYEVNDEAFIAVKKTLIRLSRLAPFPCDVNLWMPIAGHPDKVRVVIRNANELSQFWPWGSALSGHDSADEAGARYRAARDRHGKTGMGFGARAGLQQPGRHRGAGRSGQPEAA